MPFLPLGNGLEIKLELTRFGGHFQSEELKEESTCQGRMRGTRRIRNCVKQPDLERIGSSKGLWRQEAR